MPLIKKHQIYMQRCLELAGNGLGLVAPNPMVGCVIVSDGNIIGEGFHQKYGQAHAEVNAIRSVKDKNLLSGSTLYVNLEPCAHHGKTPPCANLIVQSGIKEVVIGCKDIFRKVAGKGIQYLKEAGCNVTVGILERESRDLNKRFFTFHEKQRPYVILKWAQTLDGFMDYHRKPGEDKLALKISNNLATRYVHKMRSEEQAIMVGTNTALLDDPRLNVREWKGNNPLRVVIDKTGSLPKQLHLLDGSQATLIFTEKAVPAENNVEYFQLNTNADLIAQVFEQLYQKHILSVLVEGGSKLLQSFLQGGTWDELQLIIGDQVIGEGIKAPQIPALKFREEQLDDNRLLVFYNQ